jgi:hypothetical protein
LPVAAVNGTVTISNQNNQEVNTLDKYEYNLKLDEIKKLVAAGEYEEALTIVDTIEWKRVRNSRTLCLVSEIYEANGRLEDSKEILLRAYRRSQMTRTVLFRLTEVAIKMKEFDEAVEYYSEFVNASPNDTSRYILKYEIYKGRGSSLEDQIAILEEYKEVEYTEQWGYELAKLYYKAGDKRKCIENCDDLILWFRQGKYVIKALELKKSLTDLTPMQQTIYDHREENLMPIKERVEAAVPELEKVIVDKVPANETDAITEDIISQTQRELAKAVSRHAAEANHEIPDQSWRYNTASTAEETREIPADQIRRSLEQGQESFIQQLLGRKGEETSQQIAEGQSQEIAEENTGEHQKEAVREPEIPVFEEKNAGAEDIKKSLLDGVMKRVEQIQPQTPEELPAEEARDTFPENGADEIELDTLQLQRELAESMREIISGLNRTESEGEIVEPKNDMSFFKNSPGEVQGPEQSEGKSIDDILVSMSEGREGEILSDDVAEMKEASEVQKEQHQQVSVEKMGKEAEPERTVENQREAEKKQPEKSQREEETVPQQKQAGVREEVSEKINQKTPDSRRESSGKTAEPDQYKTAKGLTLTQQYQFSYFSTIQGLQEQIASALHESIHKIRSDKTSRSGNLVITGDPGSGRTTLGIKFAKVLSAERGAASARVAKIYAEDFNKKDIASTVAKIAGGTLIIEEAGDLADEVVMQLSKAMEFRTDSLLIILEDEQSYLKELFDRHPGFAEKFTSQISIPIMTNDELVTFGKIYAYDEDYRIDDSALVALYNRIGEMQNQEHPVCIADVRDIIDEAIHHSERAGLRKLGMILSRKRYDEDDRVVLYEKDFK